MELQKAFKRTLELSFLEAFFFLHPVTHEGKFHLLQPCLKNTSFDPADIWECSIKVSRAYWDYALPNVLWAPNTENPSVHGLSRAGEIKFHLFFKYRLSCQSCRGRLAETLGLQRYGAGFGYATGVLLGLLGVTGQAHFLALSTGADLALRAGVPLLPD